MTGFHLAAIMNGYTRFQVDNPILAPAIEGAVHYIAMGTLIDGRDWKVTALSGALYGVGVRVGIYVYYLGPAWWKNPALETFRIMQRIVTAQGHPQRARSTDRTPFTTPPPARPEIAGPPGIGSPRSPREESVGLRIARVVAERAALVGGAIAATLIAHCIFRYPLHFVGKQLRADYLSTAGIVGQCASLAVALMTEFTPQPAG